MANGAAGSLVVSLGLDAADYVNGLTKAEYQARQSAENIRKNIEVGVQGASLLLTAMGVAGVAAFRAIHEEAGRIADYQDFADKIGDSASAITSLQRAADLSTTSLDTIADASVKLTSSLSKIDDESKGAGQALQAIGLDLDAFKNLSPVEQLDATAKALDEFEDGASKTAVATALFSKSGADLLPFLHDLADAGELQVQLTEDQIRQADEYVKSQAKLKSEMNALFQQMTASNIPALQGMSDSLSVLVRDQATTEAATAALNAAVKVGTVLFQTLAVVGTDVAFVFLGVGREIGAVAAQLVALAHLDIDGFRAISKAVKEDGERARAELDKWQAKVMAIGQTTDAGGLNVTGMVDQYLPNERGTLHYSAGNSGAGDDPRKKILENAIKDLDRLVAQEESILASRNKFLDLYNSQNLISTQAFYDGKRAALSESVGAQIALYDKEIAALKSYQSKAGKATERESAQGKINDLLAKKAQLTREAGEASLEFGFKEAAAAESLTRQMNQLNAELLELTGNLGAAARIRIGDQFGDLKKMLQASGDSSGLSLVAQLESYKQAQADIGQQTEGVARITEELRIQEERLALTRKIGADTDISALVKLGEARQQAVNQMTAMVEAQEAIAQASGNPALIQGAERARVELEKLRAAADPLADKFNSIFSQGLGDSLGDFINGTKSAREAFDSFVDSVTEQISRLAAQTLTNSLFDKIGSAGGGGFNIGTFFSSVFGKATGGNVGPNGLSRVNENGPELLDYQGKQYLMNGGSNARITANHKMGGSGSPIIVNVTPPAGSSRQTAKQWGEAAGRSIAVAQRSNG